MIYNKLLIQKQDKKSNGISYIAILSSDKFGSTKECSYTIQIAGKGNKKQPNAFRMI